jgi:hypothetical protein
MLYQFPIYWSDISAYSASTSLTEITITRDINLYGGPYKCRIAGLSYADNLAGGVAADNFTIIQMKSSKFVFPAQTVQNIQFINRSEHTQPWLKGDMEFIVDAMAGDIDLTITAQQFLTTRLPNVAGTWNQTGFICLILTLDIQPTTPDARLSYP